jgi:hypothetical protein
VTEYPFARDVRYWHPRIEATGLVTPETVVIDAPAGGVPAAPAMETMAEIERARAYWVFLARVLAAGRAVGFPFVLRTGLACAKHHWRSACLVTGPSEIDARVRATQAWCDARNLPVRTWAVRQYLPPPVGFTIYDGLPVGREFRVFLRDGLPLCLHPKWPRAAVDLGRPADPHWPAAFDALSELRPDTDRKVLLTLARRAATYLPGEWAVDFMAVEDGRWVAHSASPAATAWHAPDCPHHPANPGAAGLGPIPERAYSIDPDAKSDLSLVWMLDQSLEDGDCDREPAK